MKGAETLWMKCTFCGETLYSKEFRDNLKVCPSCKGHYRLSAYERVALLVDEGTFRDHDSEMISGDPLGFGEEYLTKLREEEPKTGLKEAILTGEARIGGFPVVIGCMEFYFRGGSMGSVVGEKVTRAFEFATSHRLPAVMVSSSGGARMQEGLLSLMQMAKTSAAVARHHEEGLLYISILADPTTAGVAASYASLGDLIIAEPKALIGFTGPRVIEQTIRQKLPPGFQLSEFFLHHGMIDMVVERNQLRPAVIKILHYSLGDHG